MEFYFVTVVNMKFWVASHTKLWNLFVVSMVSVEQEASIFKVEE